MSFNIRRFRTPYQFHLRRPMKMEPIRSSKTSAIKTQMPGNYAKRNILQLKHSESLKTSCRSISECYTSSEKEVPSACITQNLEVITPQSTVQLITTFPTFYGIQRVTTVFTTAHNWFIPWARSIQSKFSHPVILNPFSNSGCQDQCHHWHMLLLCATTQHILLLQVLPIFRVEVRSEEVFSSKTAYPSTNYTTLYPKEQSLILFTKSHTQKLCDGYIHRIRSQTFWTSSHKPLLMKMMGLKFWGHIHMKTSRHTYQHQRTQNNKISVLAQVLRTWNKGRNSSRLQKQTKKLQQIGSRNKRRNQIIGGWNELLD